MMMWIDDHRHQILWVGGGSGAGKTTVSRSVAMAADIAWYRVDAHAYEHRDRLVSHDGRWSVPATELVAEFVAASTQVFRLVVDDLAAIG